MQQTRNSEDARAYDEALLAAAAEAFRKHGFAGATIERIAAEAGVSRVTLHRRRVTKDGLLSALAERGAERYRAALWPALTAPGSAAARLEAAMHALCESAEENLDLLIALRAQSDSIFHPDGKEQMTRSVFTEPFERVLRDGATDGTLRELDPVETATLLFNLVGWTYVHLRTGHGWSPERARRSTIGVALHGLTTGPATPARRT